MRKLLVPVDGSSTADRAAAHAAEWAAATGDGRLLLLNVQPTLPQHHAHGLNNPEVLAELRRQGEEAAAAARALLKKSGLLYDFEVAFGPPADVIARVAQEQRCDGIVMGTRGLGDIQSALVGSTAHRVIELAAVPVTLVK